MASDDIRVRALIRLFPAVESGRTAPVLGSYRPNHNFFGPDNRDMAIGPIDLPDGEMLRPGESRVVEMSFIGWPPRSEFFPGREWLIQEGATVVGRGQILAIMD